MISPETQAAFDKILGGPAPVKAPNSARADEIRKIAADALEKRGTFDVPENRTAKKSIINQEAAASKAESDNANSFGGMVKNTLSAPAAEGLPFVGGALSLAKTANKAIDNPFDRNYDTIHILNTSNVNLAKKIHADNIAGKNSTKLKQIYNENEKKAKKLLEEINSHLDSLPSTGEAVGQVVHTGLDALTAGTYGKAASAMESGVLSKANPTLVKGAADILENKAGLFTKEGIKNVAIGALEALPIGYGYDVAQGLEGKRGSDREGGNAFIPGATTAISGVLGAGIPAARGLQNSVANKLVETPTIDQLVGRVAQGKPENIPSFTRGLENIGDTSEIKTYKDLIGTADKTIRQNVAAQDANLLSDTTRHPIENFQMTSGSGDASVKTNYVEQALDQLKNYYTKINDSEGLANIKAIENRVESQGLTVKEVNDIARTHGRDLNAFNKNSGELASGLSKQTAENTRSGLKDTVENLIEDPAVKDKFRSLDGNISDTISVKDLSVKMDKRVNALSQRLQQPNILQKIGGYIGKFGRLTGFGDLAQKLLGFDKTPGATTLSAVEIENNLAKNLAKIDAALQGDDATFIKTIGEILKKI